MDISRRNFGVRNFCDTFIKNVLDQNHVESIREDSFSYLVCNTIKQIFENTKTQFESLRPLTPVLTCAFRSCKNPVSVEIPQSGRFCCQDHLIEELASIEVLELLHRGYDEYALIDILQGNADETLESKRTHVDYKSLTTYIGTRQPECPVCIDESASDFVVFGCYHVLCYSCLSQIQKPECPLCRTKIETLFKYLYNK